MYEFEELDEVTRSWMLKEFLAEQESGNPYPPKNFSSAGRARFRELMEQAILEGNEETLARSLANPAYWQPTGTHTKAAPTRERKVTPQKAAEKLAQTEFNTWYVRGFARRLMEEGETLCEVYRAAPARQPRKECLEHEGNVYSVKDIYDGHRARYWPTKNPTALSIPVGPYCHHTIRRVAH